jgi:hypothetical protein
MSENEELSSVEPFAIGSAISVDWESKTAGAVGTENATATMNSDPGTGYRRGMTAAYAEVVPPPTIMGVV